mgnify:CR=1 FL=1
MPTSGTVISNTSPALSHTSRLTWPSFSHCARCGDELPVWQSGDVECARCLSHPPHFSVARSAGRYDGPLREVLAWFGALVAPTSVYLTAGDFEDGELSAHLRKKPREPRKH